MQTKLTGLLGIEFPIIQAPMGGSNATTPELVAAVSNSGGLGTLGAGYMSPESLREAISRIHELTTKPFGVNLFVPESYEVDHDAVRNMNETLDTWRAQFGIPTSPSLTKFAESFDAQLEVILGMDVPVCSFTFGIPSEAVMEKLKARGIVRIGTATTVREAIQVHEVGFDAVVAQGGEAGGHRGTFADNRNASPVGTMALIPQTVDSVSIPVIAAGGIMDGRGLAACLMLGAAGVQMGTAFLTCQESGVSPAYKHAVMNASGEETVLTKTFSGKEARGVENEYIRMMSTYSKEIPMYPVQNALTMDIRKAATAVGNTEYMSLWAGQGLGLATSRSAGDIVRNTVQQARQAMRTVSLD